MRAANTLGSRDPGRRRARRLGPAPRRRPELAKERWKLDIQTVTYDELGKLIKAARQTRPPSRWPRSGPSEYLKLPGTTLETKRSSSTTASCWSRSSAALMAKADCRAITINGCMGTIMPIAETTACLPLSTLNDDGYLAFCESDFVVIPSGILLANISGRPPFLNDPTYPHDGVITLAHCTARGRWTARRSSRRGS